MLVSNMAFINSAALYNNSNIHSFFLQILSHKNTDKVQLLYQHINYELYHVLTKSIYSTSVKNNVEKSMLMIMQCNTDVTFDNLVKEHFYILYEGANENRCCRFMLINILKHCMIAEWLPKIMIEYKAKILTFNESEVSATDASCKVISLCNDNINRLSGWALWKMNANMRS